MNVRTSRWLLTAILVSFYVEHAGALPKIASEIVDTFVAMSLTQKYAYLNAAPKIDNTIERIKLLDRLIESEPELMTSDLAQKYRRWCESAILKSKQCSRHEGFESV